MKEALYIHSLEDQLEEANDKLNRAKELMLNMVRVTWDEGWNYSLDVKVKAEELIKEVKDWLGE